MTKTWIFLTGILGALGVAMGAFGAHGLKTWLPLQKITIFETSVRYHMFHVLALLGTTLLMEMFPENKPILQKTAWLFSGGILLFSGSLYGYALTDFHGFVYLTPLGGVLWVMGWSLMAYGFYPRKG